MSADTGRSKPAVYCMELERCRFGDASDFRLSSWTRYERVNVPGPGEKANADVEARDGKSVTLFVLRDLGVREEILCDYGDSYEWAEDPLSDGEIPPLLLHGH